MTVTNRGRIPSRYLVRLLTLAICVTLSIYLLLAVLSSVSVTPPDNGMPFLPITEEDCREHAHAHAQEGKYHTFPKIIHQIWTTKEVPSRWKSLQQHCRKINPGYEYMLWTHAEIDKFIADNYPWFLSTYNSYPYHIEHLDAGRYFILYHYGGVYIDMDIECKVPFDSIFKNISQDADVVLGATPPVGVTSSFLAAKQRHLFMRLMTQDLIAANRWYLLPYWTVVLSTGPLYVWRSFSKFPCKELVHVIPVDLHTKVYLDHKHLSSWHSWDGPIMVWLGEHCKALVISVLGMLITLIIVLIKKMFDNCRGETDQIRIIITRK